VTAARLGRLIGRSSWRLARQLPGMGLVEEQANRLRHAASAELLRLLEVPQQFFGTAAPEEQRVMMLVQDANSDPAPLRTAMTELLSRSSETTASRSKEYLFGTIVSQLVPDEARILAALSDGREFAALDVVAKQLGRSTVRPVLANASTVGRSAGVSNPDNVPTYVTRLHNFGLVEFGPPSDSLGTQFDILAADSAVQAAQATAEARHLGTPRLVRKTLTISPFGKDFWAASDPSGAGAGRP